jgi:hypothetical protein
MGKAVGRRAVRRTPATVGSVDGRFKGASIDPTTITCPEETRIHMGEFSRIIDVRSKLDSLWALLPSASSKKSLSKRHAICGSGLCIESFLPDLLFGVSYVL